MKRIKSKIKEFLRKFFLIDDTPHKVAGGAALGIFSGIVPGEGFFTALFFAYIFRLNRLATVAGVLAVNMWTTVLILPLAALVGGSIFGINPEDLSNTFQKNYHLGWKFFLSKLVLLEVALPLLVGYLIVGLTISGIFYAGIYYLLKNHKITLYKKTNS